jgi:hypothetical protein
VSHTIRQPLIFGLLLTTLLAGGCSQAVPAPTASPTITPPPTATPSPTPSPSPSPTASPSPTSSGDAIVQLFLTNFALAQPPFKLESFVHGEVVAGAESSSLDFYIGGAVSGEDFAGTVLATSGEESVEAEIVFKDGVGYGREPGQDWERADGFSQTQPLNPFSLLAPNDVAYVGPAERDDRTLHQLRTIRWIGKDPTSVMPGAQIVSSQFDIYVDDDGIPVEADLVFEMSARIAGQQAALTYDVVYLFTEVGVPNVIEAPIP